MLGAILAAMTVAYSWLYHYLISPFEALVKDFQFAAICAVTIVFIIFSVFMMLRQTRKSMPKAYMVEIADVYGQKVSIDGVRQIFRTYEAAESFARMYRQSFAQYRFRVVGLPQGSPEIGKNGY
ncbi:MAG: hypothetical protein C4292_06245 [Nitrososphaera sp.]